MFHALLSVTPTPPTVSGILDEASSVLTEIVSWVGTVAQAIWDNKMILIFFVVPLAYIGFKVFRRLCSIA